MLSIGCPKFSLQYENPGAFDLLVETVKKHVPEEEVEAGSADEMDRAPSRQDNNELAFQVHHSFQSFTETFPMN